MTLITDEMVEKAARAILKANTGCSEKKCSECDNQWHNYASEARAALLAVLPDVVEAVFKQWPDEREFRRADGAARSVGFDAFGSDLSALSPPTEDK